MTMVLDLYFNGKVLQISLKKEHKRYPSFFRRISDPYGSRHNTES